MNYFCPRPEFLLQARAKDTTTQCRRFRSENGCPESSRGDHRGASPSTRVKELTVFNQFSRPYPASSQRDQPSADTSTGARDTPQHNRFKSESGNSKSSRGDRHATDASTRAPNTHQYRRFRSESESTYRDLRLADSAAEDQRKYDFYLAVPEEDLEHFGIPFCEMVESRMNMKACMSIHVDIGMKYENMARTLERECGGKVVFVVSRSFPNSDECQFLVHFAKTLDPDAKSAKLIPLEIDKEVPLPQVLKGLTSIRYNAAVRENWLGEVLWIAVKGGQRPPRLRSISSPAP